MNNQLNKKNIFVIIIFVIFATLLSFMIFKYYNSQKNNSVIIDNNQNKDNDIEVSNNKSEGEVENELPTKGQRLEDSDNFTLATEGNEPEKCDDIKNDGTKNQCYKRIATLNNDIDYCNKLPNSDQVTCKFGIFKSQAKKEKNVDLCLELKEDYLIKKCINDVLDQNYCDNDECYNEFLENIDKYDSDGDGIIDDKEKYIYKTDENNKDTDNDGLNDYEEIFEYKTNPKLPDTDEDGYSDGVEVKSGYDPLN
ncbi:thrombospondin type 3 repeat-containing protein [bacterium]|nr:thrombospondin type 3 repeat-containing protein [bacterium]